MRDTFRNRIDRPAQPSAAGAILGVSLSNFAAQTGFKTSTMVADITADEITRLLEALGVISGAVPLRSAIRLGADAPLNKSTPFAKAGTAYCLVDASFGAIEVGDLLTTLAFPGHAMKVEDAA